VTDIQGLFPKGGLLLEMTVPDHFELRKFVLSFGSKVKVLAPESLIEFIKKERETNLYDG
jgi:predicted DNA-binding transcriptional regulator YafY